MNNKKAKTLLIIIIPLAFILALIHILYFYIPGVENFTSKWSPEARIDIKASKGSPQRQLHVFKDDKELSKENWDKEIDTYVINSWDKKVHFHILPDTNVKVDIILRGPHPNKLGGKHRKKVWVKYYSVKINGKEALEKEQTVWHDKPYITTFNAEKGKKYIITVTWGNP